MRSFFSVRPKFQIAIILFVLPLMLLAGILIERHFLQRVDSTSTALYEDRLMPATFVYQLTDLTHQRHRLAEQLYLRGLPGPSDEQLNQIARARLQTDSILTAFEQTYLVQDEATSLGRLRTELEAYRQVEQRQLTNPSAVENLYHLEDRLDAIRGELLQLSSIQTVVGRELLDDAESTVASAHALNKFEIAILILCLLLVQILLLTSRSTKPPIAQKPNLN